jgi:4-amino-4-deoxy-L-arabinose transferase-like glycosyltransferase
MVTSVDISGSGPGGRWPPDATRYPDVAQCAALSDRSPVPPDAGPFALITRPGWPAQRTWSTGVAAAVLVVVLSIPLFLGLDRQDIQNDEAIYTYASQRIVETGDWLTPRYVATDGLFLEKPPLKFWVVASALTLGLIPNDEAGIRLVDAFFGAIAFGYIMALGWRVAGVVCGAVALLLLLSFHPLLFDHGLRENNMESALFLSYAAGLFHFACWAAGGTTSRRRSHAMACALWFVLGFMTKFVAAVFLPMTAVAALIVTTGGWKYLRLRWTDWILPAILSSVLVLPWFAYQMVVRPEDFWQTIFGAHVYQRFTTFVDPAHLQPWHFYFTNIWFRFDIDAASYRRLLPGNAAHLAIIGGLLYAAWRAIPRARPTAALLLLWWALPFGLISLGSSKVTHYAYPFLPPLGLAAGWLCADAMAFVDRRVVPWLRVRADALRFPKVTTARARWALAAACICAVTMAAATYWAGPLTVSMGDSRLFRNSSSLRPLLVAALLLVLLGRLQGAVRMVSVGLLVLLLPVETASRTVTRALIVDRPLSAARDCLSHLVQSDPDLRRGFYVSDPLVPELAVHQLFYSFRNAGPWIEGMSRFDEEVHARLTTSSRQGPMLLSPAQWIAVQGSLPGASTATTPAGMQVAPGVVLVLPGPYRSCVPPVISAGGRIVERPAAE